VQEANVGLHEAIGGGRRSIHFYVLKIKDIFF